MSSAKKALISALVLGSLFTGSVGGLYLTVPQSNTRRTHFDVIIVLGYPTQADGTPSPEERERVLEAVREYRAGEAPRILMTGGAAHNKYVEAHSMAEIAVDQQVPWQAIFEENQAQNTIQNAYYSVKIMQANGWRSAEVVSSPSHLPRASLIFRYFPIEWQMHACPWPREYSLMYAWAVYSAEALYTSRLRIFGFHRTPFLPQAAARMISNRRTMVPALIFFRPTYVR
jgi:uncharacterized SAM-binding protein YcdF (DUF218 family)